MFISREYIRKNKNCLFIFGDNIIKKGYGGMAKSFRGEPNTIGIPTKYKPSNTLDSFFNDKDYNNIWENIENSLNKIIIESKKYDSIYIPCNLGKGLAKMNIKSPKLYEALMKRLRYIANYLIKSRKIVVWF